MFIFTNISNFTRWLLQYFMPHSNTLQLGDALTSQPFVSTQYSLKYHLFIVISNQVWVREIKQM